MKTKSIFTGRIASAFFALAIAMISFTAVQASPISGTPTNEATFTSLGVVKGEIVFKLTYENVNGDNLEVVLLDKDGSRLYRQVFTDKNLNRTFKVPSEVESFVVRVTNLTTKEEQKFQV